jgi:mannose/fructose-specific phosphotransferase system component IIA
MTIASQLKQTVASLKGVQETLKTFATHYPEQQSQAVLENNIDKIKKVIANIENRVEVLEFEEPQYKGY